MICLNFENVTEIYATSDMLQVIHLKEICHDYLVSQIHSSNVTEIWMHARHFSDTTLETFTSRFVLEHLNEVCQHSDILELVQFNDMSTLSLQCCSKEMNYVEMINNTNFEQLVLSIISHCSDSNNVVSTLLPVKEISLLDKNLELKNKSGSESALVAAGGYSNGLVRICESFSFNSLTWTEKTVLKLPKEGYCHWVRMVGVRMYAMTGYSPISVNTLVSMLSPPAVACLHTRELDTGWEYEFTAPYDCSNMKFCVMEGHVLYGCGIVLNDRSSSEDANSPMLLDWKWQVGNSQGARNKFQSFFPARVLPRPASYHWRTGCIVSKCCANISSL